MTEARTGRACERQKRHLSPPPIRLDLPPARMTPTTRFGRSPSCKLRLQTRSCHVQDCATARLAFLSMSLASIFTAHIFVHRNLPDRIKLRIGEDVGSRLDISKRDEDHPLSDPFCQLERQVQWFLFACSHACFDLAQRQSVPASLGCRLAVGPGSSWSSTSARRVMAPVCQCSS